MRIQSLAGKRKGTPRIERIKRGRAATVIILSGRKPKKKVIVGQRDPKKQADAIAKKIRNARAQGRASALKSLVTAKKRTTKSAVRKTIPQGVRVVRTPGRKGRTLVLAGRTGRLMGGFAPSLKNVIGSAKPVAIGIVGAIAGMVGINYAGRWVSMSPRTTNLVGLGVGLGLPFMVKRPEAKVAGFGLAILSGYNLIWDAWGGQIKSMLRLGGSTAFAPQSLAGATSFGPAPSLAGATQFSQSYSQPIPAMSGYRCEDDGM